MTTDRFDLSGLRQTLVLLVSVKVVALILSFDAAGLQAFDLPKTLFSHAISWLIGGILLLTVLRFGLAIVPRTHLHLAVAIFLGANLLSAAAAADPYIAIFGEQSRYLGVTFLLDMVVLYLAVAVAFRSTVDLAVLGLAIACATLITLGYAAAQHVGVDPIRWAGDLAPAGDFPNAPFGTFGQTDFLGHYLSVIFAIGLAIASARMPFVFRAGGVAFVLLAAAAATAVGTRGTVVGFAAAFLALGLIAVRGESLRSETARPVLPIAVGVLLISSLVLLPLGTRESDAWQGLGSGRLRIYESAALAVLDRPLFGYGPDNFSFAYAQHRRPRPGLPSDSQSSAHNWVLQAAATTGLVGLVALLAVIALFARVLWLALPRAPVTARVIALALAAYWGHALVATGAVAVDWLPWTAFGLIAGLAAPTRGRVLRQWKVTPFITVPMIAVTIAGALTGLNAYRANLDAGAARQALVTGDLKASTARAEAAVAGDPGRADYWNWLGLAHERSGNLSEAVDAYERATRQSPHEPTYWSNLALALARLPTSGEGGERDSTAVVAAAERAVAVDPTGWRGNEVLAEVALAVGANDLALRGAVATVLLGSTSAAVDAIAAAAAPLFSDVAEAARLLDSALATRESAVLHVARAEVAARAGESAVARQHATRALELDPSNADAPRFLAAR